MNKACTKCLETKPESEFYLNKRTGKPLAKCKKCTNAANYAWKKENLERHKETNKAWVKKNRARVNENQRRWKERNPGIANLRAKEWREANYDRAKENVRRRDKEIKDMVFNAYGGYRCNCCGETIQEFLTIDHVNNDGAKHRKEICGEKKASGKKVYRWIVNHGFPEGFQVLCMNCNWGRAHSPNHVCPHKKVQKPSETISKESRPQVNNGGRSARPLIFEGEDIVQSSWRHEAVFCKDGSGLTHLGEC